MSKFLARRTAVQRFNFSLPSPFPPPPISQLILHPVAFLSRIGKRKSSCPFTGTKPSGSWINRATRVIIRFRDSAPLSSAASLRGIAILSISLEESFNRSFPFSLLALRPAENLYGIEIARCCDENSTLVTISISFEEEGKAKFKNFLSSSWRDKIPNYSKFLFLSRSMNCSRLFRNS